MEYCVGCGVCVVACKLENNLPPHVNDKPGTIGIAWNRVVSITEGIYPKLLTQHLTVHCMHCENPPCMAACPKDAIKKQKDGIVLISGSKCNACEDQPGGEKKCISACPYGAIRFNAEKGVVQACTLCAKRIKVGLEPACVRACVSKALIFGDLNDPASKVSKAINEASDRIFVLKSEEKTDPSVRYIWSKRISLEQRTDLARVIDKSIVQQ
jgi:Fe-S-cluster-containing dehydrogenase component